MYVSKVGLYVVQSSDYVWLFVTPWTATRQASLPSPSLSLPKFMSIELVRPSNHLIFCRPLLPSVFPSIRVFSNELALCIRWPKYWSFSFTIRPSNEYSGLISFRIDWFALLAVQGTLKCLLQHYSSKQSVLWCSASPALTCKTHVRLALLDFKTETLKMKTVWYCHRIEVGIDRHGDPWRRIYGPETDAHLYGKLIFLRY